MTPATSQTSASVLLTVSGAIDSGIHEQIARGVRPRADYLELAAGLGAELMDYVRARNGGAMRTLLSRMVGNNVMLAWACFRERHRLRAVFTDGEQVGIPLALLFKLFGRGKLRCQHVMIVHTLTVRKKMIFLDWFGLQSHIDRFFVYATAQKRFIEQRWNVPSHRVVLTAFMVDERFYSQAQVPQGDARESDTPTICAVGLERRDYPTLMNAVRGLDVRVVIAAASPWSTQADETQRAEIPPNVEVRKFGPVDLRQLYADSAFMVMPLYDVQFQAGVTAILEALAMSKPVICSRTSGQTDVIVDGVNGVYVPPGDVAALRAAISRCLMDVAGTVRMGANGRATIEATMTLDHYVVRLRQHLDESVAIG